MYNPWPLISVIFFLGLALEGIKESNEWRPLKIDTNNYIIQRGDCVAEISTQEGIKTAHFESKEIALEFTQTYAFNKMEGICQYTKR